MFELVKLQLKHLAHFDMQQFRIKNKEKCWRHCPKQMKDWKRYDSNYETKEVHISKWYSIQQKVKKKESSHVYIFTTWNFNEWCLYSTWVTKCSSDCLSHLTPSQSVTSSGLRHSSQQLKEWPKVFQASVTSLGRPAEVPGSTAWYTHLLNFDVFDYKLCQDSLKARDS